MKREVMKKVFSVTVLSIMLISFLSSCSEIKEVKEEKWEKHIIPKENIEKAREAISPTTSTWSESKVSDLDSDGKKLWVNSSCIWCNKCVRIAPNHFSMNENRKAEAINQKDLNSEEVQFAIQACPVDAISIW